MRKTTAILLALSFLLCLLPALPAGAASDYSYVKVKLTANNATSLTLYAMGEYFIAENGVAFNGGTVSVRANGGSLIVSHSSYGDIYAGKTCTLKRAVMDRGAGYITFNGRKYLGHFNLKASGSYIQVVNEVPMAHYLYGVVGYEMSDLSFGAEALKAQAIAAKGYVIAQMGLTADYDIGDTSADQVYKGYNASYTAVIAAVDSTLEQVLVANGSIFRTYFAASNGGETNLPGYAWAGQGRSDAGYAVVQDPFDLANTLSLCETVRIPVNTAGSISSALYAFIAAKAGAALNTTVTGIEGITGVSLSGEAYAGTTRNLTIGTMSVTVLDAMGAMQQASFSFRLSELYANGVVKNGSLRVYWGEPVGDYYYIYHLRYGHGVGLSQRGAQERAAQGQSYQQILAFYYPGATLSTTGAIYMPQNPINALAGTAQAVTPVVSSAPVTGGVTEGVTGGATEGVIGYGVINYDNTNYRSGPSTSYPSYGKLNTGTALELYGESGGWYMVGVAGVRAYVYKQYVDLTGSAVTTATAPVASNLPSTPVTLEPATPAASALPMTPVATAVPEAGAASVQGAGVTTGNVNLRSGPATSHEKLATLKKNTSLVLLAQENGWYKVTANGKSGYVSGKYIKVSAYPAAAAPVAATTATSTSGLPAAGVTTTNVNFRKGPSTSTKKLARIPKGTSVVLYALQNGWFEAGHNDVRGYISAEYVRGGAALAGAVDTAAVGSIIPETVPAGSAVADTALAGSTAANTAVTPPTGVCSGTVNFRAQPSTASGKILARLPKDAKVQLLGKCKTWYYALYDGKAGYISDAYVRVQNAGTFGLFTVAENAAAYTTTTKDSVNLRGGPATTYAVLRELPAKAKVTVYLLADNWCLVQADGAFGFLHADYVNVR